jgi:hypothetical protein
MLTPWAQKKKNSILAIFALIFLGIVAGVYFMYFTPDPTCFDGKQNGDELGVDCGGSCALLCPFQIRPVVTWWSRALPVGGDVYHLVAYIENPNAASGAHDVRYRFRFYDENNLLIAEREGMTFVVPLEKTAIFEPHVQIGNRIPGRVFFDIIGQPTWSVLPPEMSFLKLGITDQKIERVSTAPLVTALVRNNYDFDLFDTEFVLIVYGLDDNALSVSNTRVPRIAVGAREQISFTWSAPFPEPVGRIEIIPRINMQATRSMLGI